MHADPTTHPRLYGFQARSPFRWLAGLLPDAVTDTTAKRRRRAATLLGDGCGTFSRLLALGLSTLHHIVVPLRDDADLYLDAPVLARRECARLFGSAPHFVVVARGRCGRLHLHVLISLNRGVVLGAGLNGPLHITLVNDLGHLRTLAQYFSRPSDERAAKPDRKAVARFSHQALSQMRLDAGEDYLRAVASCRAKGRRSLPRRSWTANLPRLKAKPATVYQLAVLRRRQPSAQATSMRPQRSWLPSAARRAVDEIFVHTLARAPP